MKNSFLIFITIFILAVLPVFAQEAEKWLRIETEDKEFSFAFPRTNIIDTEKRDFGQRLRILAFENGVEMEIRFIKDGDAEKRIGRISETGNSKSEVIKVGDFLIRKFTYNNPSDKKIFNTIVIAKDSNFYSLIVRSKTGQEKELARFLYSIKLNGKPLIARTEEMNFPEETIAVSALETSPEIVEAEKRKTGKFKGNVTYELLSNADDGETEDLTHKAIILEKPIPNFEKPQFPDNGVIQETRINIQIKVQFRADGQIGDMIVYSGSEKHHIKTAIDAARKIRFVPARRGGEFVDSFQIVQYFAGMLPEMNVIRRF